MVEVVVSDVVVDANVGDVSVLSHDGSAVGVPNTVNVNPMECTIGVRVNVTPSPATEDQRNAKIKDAMPSSNTLPTVVRHK